VGPEDGAERLDHVVVEAFGVRKVRLRGEGHEHLEVFAVRLHRVRAPCARKLHPQQEPVDVVREAL
jgi:hypothetical protein